MRRIKEDPELFNLYCKVAETGLVEKQEIYSKPLNRWLSLSVYSPVKGYFAVVFDDISERKDAEAVLRQSEEKFKQLALNSPDTIYVIDTITHRIDFVNCNDFLGYTLEELKGKGSILHTIFQ